MPLPMYPEKKKKSFHTIAVASGKGGVGKSTIAVNLALALKQKGHQVGIMDTDIYGPSVRKMLPEDRMLGQKGERFQPALSHGIRIISMAYFRQEHEAAVVRAPIANGVVSQFIHQVDWGDLDFLIIDFPPGTGDVQLTLSQQANITGAVMVTTPQEIAVMDVKKAMHLFDQVQIPVLGVVENMSGICTEGMSEWVYPFGQGGGEKLAREAGVPFLGSVPIDPILCQKSDRGESILNETTPAKEALIKLTDNMVRQIDALDQAGLQQFELVWKEMKE